jgi:hypothetical protein
VALKRDTKAYTGTLTRPPHEALVTELFSCSVLFLLDLVIDDIAQSVKIETIIANPDG